MSVVYAESSAVLRWLLGTPDAPLLQAALASAAQVVTSTLTSAEVGRTLRRLTASGILLAEARSAAWVRYQAAAARWSFYAVTDEVLDRAGGAFPSEPLRTLDAIHLATASLYAGQVESPSLLSVDLQVRQNARGIGLRLLPEFPAAS